MMLSIPQAKKVLDALNTTYVHPESFDFGPAYEAARARHEEATRIMRQYIKDAAAVLQNWGRP